MSNVKLSLFSLFPFFFLVSFFFFLFPFFSLIKKTQNVLIALRLNKCYVLSEFRDGTLFSPLLMLTSLCIHIAVTAKTAFI